MSRVVLIVDSSSGALIDVQGNVRETGRYARFAKRLLSLSKNPTLDYGVNGGDTLNVSQGGETGEAINLYARLVNISGTLKVGGKTIAEMTAEGAMSALERLKGTEGQITVTPNSDSTVQIALDPEVLDWIDNVDLQLADIYSKANKYVSKQELAVAIDGIEIDPADDIEAVKTKFALLLSRLATLADDGSDSEEP